MSTSSGGVKPSNKPNHASTQTNAGGKPASGMQLKSPGRDSNATNGAHLSSPAAPPKPAAPGSSPSKATTRPIFTPNIPKNSSASPPMDTKAIPSKKRSSPTPTPPETPTHSAQATPSATTQALPSSTSNSLNTTSSGGTKMDISDSQRESTHSARKSEDSEMAPPEPKRAVPAATDRAKSLIEMRLEALKASLALKKEEEAPATPARTPHRSNPNPASVTVLNMPKLTKEDLPTPPVVETPPPKMIAQKVPVAETLPPSPAAAPPSKPQPSTPTTSSISKPTEPTSTPIAKIASVAELHHPSPAAAPPSKPQSSTPITSTNIKPTEPTSTPIAKKASVVALPVPSPAAAPPSKPQPSPSIDSSHIKPTETMQKPTLTTTPAVEPPQLPTLPSPTIQPLPINSIVLSPAKPAESSSKPVPKEAPVRILPQPSPAAAAPSKHHPSSPIDSPRHGKHSDPASKGFKGSPQRSSTFAPPTSKHALSQYSSKHESKKGNGPRLLKLPHHRDCVFSQNLRWANCDMSGPEARTIWLRTGPAWLLGEILPKIGNAHARTTLFEQQEDSHKNKTDTLPLIETSKSLRDTMGLSVALELTYLRHDGAKRIITTTLGMNYKTLRDTAAVLALGDILFATRLAGKEWLQKDAYRETLLIVNLPNKHLRLSVLDELKELHQDVRTDRTLALQRQELFERLAQKHFSSQPEVYDLWIPLNKVPRDFDRSSKGRLDAIGDAGERQNRSQISSPLSPPSSPSLHQRDPTNINIRRSDPNLRSSAPSAAPHFASPSAAPPLPSAPPSMVQAPSEMHLPIATPPPTDHWSLILNFSAIQDPSFLQALIRFLLKRFALPKHESDFKMGNTAKQIEISTILKLFGLFRSNVDLVANTLNEPIVNLDANTVRTGYDVIKKKILAGCDKSQLPLLMDLITDGIPRCPAFTELAKTIFDPIFVSHLPKLGTWMLSFPSLEDMSAVAHAIARTTFFAYTSTGSVLNPHACGLGNLIESLEAAQARFGQSQQLESIIAKLTVFVQMPPPIPSMHHPQSTLPIPSQSAAPPSSSMMAVDYPSPAAPNSPMDSNPALQALYVANGVVDPRTAVDPRLAVDPRINASTSGAVDPRLHPGLTAPIPMDPRSFLQSIIAGTSSPSQIGPNGAHT